MKYSLSDHHDGQKFFNPNKSEEPGLWKSVKMLTSLRFKKWPNFVENKPVLNLNCALRSDQIAITFINHATVLIQLPELNILTDPVWSKRVSPLSWSGPKRVREPGIDFDSLPKIDLVLISHNHYDHMDLTTLKRLNQRFSPQMLAPLGDRPRLKSEGIGKVEKWIGGIQP